MATTWALCIPSELPANEKLHNLASLHCHQQILQEHWGSGDTAVLPGDDVQHLLLGVSTILSI